jgi:hypothetical protein
MVPDPRTLLEKAWNLLSAQKRFINLTFPAHYHVKVRQTMPFYA